MHKKVCMYSVLVLVWLCRVCEASKNALRHSKWDVLMTHVALFVSTLNGGVGVGEGVESFTIYKCFLFFFHSKLSYFVIFWCLHQCHR